MSKSAKSSSRKRARSVGTTCDWRSASHERGSLLASPEKSKEAAEKSTVFRHTGNYKWKGTKTEAYKLKKDDWSKIIRRSLIGDELKSRFHVRYFEIAPGGQSSFEKHRHEHIVIGIRGKGKVLLGKKPRKVAFLDVVYVSPNTPHQFLNPFNEPFGFLCVVSAKRDKPVPLGL